MEQYAAYEHDAPGMRLLTNKNISDKLCDETLAPTLFARIPKACQTRAAFWHMHSLTQIGAHLAPHSWDRGAMLAAAGRPLLGGCLAMHSEAESAAV